MHVLIIDDEPALADALHRLLERMVPRGWVIFHTTNPVEGRALLVLDPRVRFAVVDILMPGLAGDSLIEEAVRARPSLRGKIIVSSGLAYSPDVERRLFDELGCLRLDKPAEVAALEAMVCSFVLGE